MAMQLDPCILWGMGQTEHDPRRSCFNPSYFFDPFGNCVDNTVNIWHIGDDMKGLGGLHARTIHYLEEETEEQTRISDL